MKRYILHAFLLSFLLHSAVIFPMLRRINQKKYDNLLQQQVAHLHDPEEIDRLIDKIKNDIYMECIEETASLTAYSQEDIRTLIDQGRKKIKEALRNNNDHLHYDHNIPAQTYENIIAALRSNDINPNNITLKYVPGDEYKATADSRSPIFFLPYPSPGIDLHDKYLQLTQSEQYFVCNHELHHMLLRHSAILFLTKKQTPRLTSIIEQEADIHAASKNVALACNGALYRCTHPHLKIIDGQAHCKEMQRICMLMLRKKELLHKSM